MRATVTFPRGKRAAKREACRVVALLIENYFDVGQPHSTAVDEGGLDEDDPRIKIMFDAFVALRNELERRGQETPHE
jgi:hypothetical protein